MKKLLFLLAMGLLITTISFAQTKLSVSPFSHIPAPQKNLFKATVSNSVTAYRFVLPFAGYSPLTKQISTGIGYGWNKLHYVDSTQRYYTDLSVFGAIFINGNVTPTPYNFTSVGIGIGLLNNLIVIAPCYNLPNADHQSGAFDLKISFGVPLN